MRLCYYSTGSRPRLDVLVQPKQVRRIVFGLQGDETVVVGGAIAVAHQLLPLLAEAREVEISAAAGTMLHVTPEGARPGQVALVVGRTFPDRIDAQHVPHVALAEGGRVAGHPADGTAQIPDRAERQVGGPIGGAWRDLVDQPVVQAVEIERLE